MALAIFTLMVSACSPKTPEVSIKLTVSPSLLKVKVGEVGSIKAKVTPEETAIAFSSTDNKIATVNEKGEVKGVAEGTTTIIVKAGEKTKKVSVLVYKSKIDDPEIDDPEIDYSARMIGNKDNKLAPPFYIPERALMKERFEEIKAANKPFGWRYINKLLNKDADQYGYYFAPITEDGEDYIDDRYVKVIQYDYPQDSQDKVRIALFTEIYEDQNPFATEPGKKMVKEIAEAYGFTEDGKFDKIAGNRPVYIAFNRKLGNDEQLSIIIYASLMTKGKVEGKYRVLAYILYHYHKDHD